MTPALVRLELLRLRRSIAAKAILAFALVASLYAVWSGLGWRDAHTTMLGDYEDVIAARMQDWADTLVGIEEGTVTPLPFAARPGDIQIAATHPVGPLGHMAIGNAELLPTRVNITPLRTRMSMIEPYEFDNPTTLSLGRFDLAFFTVVVLPLLMIALSFDVIASDRSRGTLKLLLSNPVSTRNILATRLIVRNGLLVLLTLAATIVGIVAAGAGSLGYGLLWFGASVAYIGFWLALIYAVVSRVKRNEATAAMLISLWVLFTLAIPALTNSAGEAAYPLPSRLAYLSDARVAQNEASKQTSELTENFLSDHPELTVSDEFVPAFYSAIFLANEQIQMNTAPVVDAFDESNSRRGAFVDRLQYLSPAIIAQRALFRIAGSDFDQAQMFTRTAAAVMEDLDELVRPAIISRNRLESELIDAIPDFTLEAAQPGAVFRQILFPVSFLLVCAALLAAFAHPRQKDSPL